MSNELAIKADNSFGLPVDGMAPGLAIMFNEALYTRCKEIAGVMSRASGITPNHLLGHGEACFAVVTRSITWKLDPFAVAQSTYQTPGGKVGYEGKLIQAILENSGKLDGPVTYEHFGDWSKVMGKWKKAKSAKGNEFAVQGWEDKDEEGLGVIVRAVVKGEKEPREFRMYLRECYPRNSTLWALRPSQQICYTAARAFANVAAPGLLMGVPFSGDDDSTMIDVTPVEARRPQRSEPMAEKATPEPKAEEQRIEEDLQADAADLDDPGAVETEADGAGEFGVPDAYRMGEEARDLKRSIFSFPKEWEQMKREDLIEGFKEGFRAREEELKAPAK